MDFAARRTEMLRFLDAVYRYPHTGADLSLFTLPAKTAFRPASFEEAAQEACTASLDEAVHVYLACCMLTTESAAKGSYHRGDRDDAAVIPGTWVDLDLDGPAHKSDALPPDQEAGLKLLAGMAYEPSLIIDSGWGLYGWWLFDKPRALADTEARERANRLVEGCQLSLRHLAAAGGWTLDTTSDLARVLRPPGTINHKVPGESRHVRILHESGKLYAPAELTAAWGNIVPEKKGPAAPLPERITTGNRTKSIESLAGTNRRRNVLEEATLAAALIHNEKVCDPPLSEEKVRETVAGIYGRYEPAGGLITPNGHGQSNGHGKVGSKVILRPFSSFRSLPIDFTWEPGIERGGLNLLAGDPGYGKGLIATSLAAAVTAGKPVPGNQPEAGEVLWVTYEESIERALRPRLEVVGADLDRVYPLLISRPDGREDKFLKVEDVPLLEETMSSGRFRLMILDPLLSFIGGQRNINQGNDVRDALDPLVDLAERHQFGILGIVHVNKSELTKTLYRISNSVAFVALARSVMGVGDLGDGRRCLAHIKTNNALPFTPVPYTVVGVLNRSTGRSTGRVVWEEPDPEIDLARLFESRSEKKDAEPTRAQECAGIITDMMGGQTVYAEFIKAQLVAKGFSVNAIRYGRQAAGVTVTGAGTNTRWHPPISPDVDTTPSATTSEVDLTESVPGCGVHAREESGATEPEEWDA